MRKIIITEENFENVLKNILKFTNKYKMFQFYSAFDKNMNLKYKNNSIGFKPNIIKNKKGEFKSRKQFALCSRYFRVTKHLFRKKFELGVQDYDVNLYNERKTFIHIDLKGGSALVINEGDKIRFIPFIGFILWQEEEKTIYRYGCIIDFIKGRIKNLEQENIIREEEWNEEAKWWNEHDNNYDSYDYF